MKSFLQWWQQRPAHRHRQLIVMDSHGIELIEHLYQQHAQRLWLGYGPDDAVDTRYYRNILGQTFDFIVVNGSKLRANVLLAAEGCLRAAGTMILVLPDNPHYYSKPLLSYGHTHHPDHFLQYFMQLLNDQAEVAWFTKQHIALPPITPLPNWSQWQAQRNGQLAKEQQNVIESVSRGLKQRINYHVLSADRGRGKSFALAHLIHYLVNTGISVAVTAYKPILMREIKQQLITLGSIDKVSKLPIDANDWQQFDVVIIDEAATLNQQQLQQIYSQAKAMVLASTFHGYEGSGRHFQHRFLPAIEAQHTVNKYTLQAPKRFPPACPLEQILLRLLSYKISPLPKVKLVLKRVTFRCLPALSLVNEAATRERVIQLLIQAHYQTQPDDLQRFMDSPDGFLFVAEQDGQIIACCFIQAEGNDNLYALKTEILNGSRRPQGHMTIQKLQAYAPAFDWLALPVWRISRIAVLPGAKQQGLGSHLLRYIIQYAQQAAISVLSVSFNANSELVRFWQHNDFALLLLSPNAENSICALGLDRQGQQMVTQTARLFNEEQALYRTIDCIPINEHDRLRLRSFALGQRDIYASALSLAKLFCQHSFVHNQHLQILLAYLEGQPLKILLEAAQFDGINDFTQQCRQAVNELLG